MANINYKLIESIEQLKKESSNKYLECFITLRGSMRSSKDIKYHAKTNSFTIYHHVDGERETLTEKEFENSFTMEALNKKALYKYN